MQTVGYKSMTIAILDSDYKVVTGKKFKIDGTPKKGATATFELTGLTKEAVKVYGSNIPYLLFRKGVGNVACNFGVLDMPSENEHELLGHEKGTNGVYHVGESTEPPYCAVLIESENLYGEPVGIGLYVGTFSRDGYSGATLDDEDFKPEPGEYVFAPISKKLADGKNHTVGFADDETSFKALEIEVFGATTTGGD